ncbi:MAG: RNA-directed DNA polymerase [Rhodocyclaceae bacterium]
MSASSADRTDALTGHADFSFEALVQAYFDCRRAKRNRASALEFEIDLERNLTRLHDELVGGTYRPGPSVCFVVTRPKAREVWAAQFRDRIVHHLLYSHIAARVHARFIADSCACIPERGTLYAARRLAAKVRSATQNWQIPVYYLKCDVANFFVSIDKSVLATLLAQHINEPWWQALAEMILFHDPRPGAMVRSGPDLMGKVPAHKSLINQPAHLGLPIGNLSSQFFANVYLDVLDQHVKHVLHAKHYVRYVDDFVLLHESTDVLNAWLADIRAFLPRELHITLNDRKTVLQPVDRGVDFVGHLIKPWHTRTRPRTVRAALRRLECQSEADLFESGNSYFGLLRQAPHSHHDRARIAKAMLKRGYTVNLSMTKAYRKAKESA